MPDIVLFGHVDNLEYNDFTNLKEKFKNIIFSQYFVDTLDKNYENYNIMYLSGRLLDTLLQPWS